MAEKNSLPETITFLGTGGARFMIISQVLASGGFWLNLDGTQLLVDPGPGCIVQTTKRKLDARQLSGIILSHRHLDHSADVNVMVEAMTNGGWDPNGRLFLPQDALEPEPVIYSYLRHYLDGIEILREGGSYSIDNVSFSTPLKHIHRVETYGITFRTARHTFSYIADTRYFDGLLASYRNSDLLIINLVFLEPRPPSDHPRHPADHLAVPDAERIVRELKPKAAILTHFGTTVWRAGPQQIAAVMSQRTGVNVIAARDGMVFDMDTLESCPETS